MSFFIFICKGIENILGENAIYLILQHENHIEHIIYMNLPSDFVTRTRSLMGEEQFEN